METKRLFVQCLSDTSIHGFRYTVDRQLKVCENVLWTVLTFGFLSIGIYLVHVSIFLVFQFQNLMNANYDFMMLLKQILPPICDKAKYLYFFKRKSASYIYRTRAIITRGLYIFYLTFILKCGLYYRQLMD